MRTTAHSQAVAHTNYGDTYMVEPAHLAVAKANQEPPPPEIGKIFLDDIVAGSAILALPETPTRKEIIDAYGTDIETLQQRRKEADAFMLQILTCAMVRCCVDLPAQDQERFHLKKLLLPLGLHLEIPLTAAKAAEDPTALAAWLKNEFRRELDKVAYRISAALNCLVSNEVIGFVNWAAPDICMFHYFRWEVEIERRVMKAEMTDGDIYKWNTLTRTVNTTARINRTRSTHHVVDASLHQAAGYGHPMPARIVKLIAAAPSWLQSNLLVVHGDEILAETSTQLADETDTTTVESVRRWDPAITLGNFVFAGWNLEEVTKEKAAFDAAVGGAQKTVATWTWWCLVAAVLMAFVYSLL